jgi:hypothetical protein
LLKKQAAAGEAARQVVYISLNSAKIDCPGIGSGYHSTKRMSYLSSGTAPMEDVYTRIVSLQEHLSIIALINCRRNYYIIKEEKARHRFIQTIY